MEPQKFIRRPFSLEAVQVTPLNYKEVAAWCKGEAIETDYRMMGGVHKMGAVLLPKQGPKNNRVHTVLIGSWITKHRGQFRWWKPEQFESQFAPSAPTFRKNDLVKVLPGEDVKTWENWEGKVIDPMLIGVDFGIRGMVVFEPSQLTKIREMDSLQLEFNAGIEIASSPEAMLEQMREESKDKIAALEKENLEYDDVIRVGDLVKVLEHETNNEHSATYVGQCGHVVKHDNLFRVVEFATADPEKPEFVTFLVDALEKLRQDGEPLNTEEPFNFDIPPALVWENGHLEQVEKIGEEDLNAHLTLHTDGTVEEHVPLDVAAVGGPNNVDYSALVRGSEDPEFTKKMDAFEVGDLVETLVEHDFDGVTIPVGTNGRVVVIGVELPDHKEEGVEVMFADGHYHSFLSEAIAKV